VTVAFASIKDPHYQPLSWDSAHFGMAVGRLVGDVGDNATLAQLLDQAKAAGACLVYFLHTRPFTVEQLALETYGGRRVAGYVRFALPLPAPTATAGPPEGVVLDRYHGPVDDPRVLALGMAAGWLSRFRRDDRLPREKCDQLYDLWTRRSIAGQMADEVLVAWRQDAPIGLVSYTGQGDLGEIGLVGVAESARGGGIGRALLALAHRRMCDRGLRRAEVVTQSENQGACRLYRGVGYSPIVVGASYHFMLAAGENAWTSR
jgi:ribosomal protein S18 acetylase RimI-like enzyme